MDGSNAFYTFVVYGSPTSVVREGLWQELRHLAETLQPPLVVLGDFNAYLDKSEKSSGTAPNRASVKQFKPCLCPFARPGF